MKISVIIPVHNEEKYLENCLRHIFKQDEKPAEIIIIDNNSSDNSIKIAQKYPVKIVKEKKQGAVFARNRGFDEANSELIARCDADTLVPPDWIKRIKNNFENNKKAVALSGPSFFYDLPFNLLTLFLTRVYFRALWLIQNKKHTLIGPNMVIKKTIWKKIKKEVCLNEKVVHEDIDLAIHINKNGGEIIYDDKLIVAISGRRIRNNPFSFFVEYPWRLIKTYFNH